MLGSLGKFFGHPWGLLEDVLGQLRARSGGPGVLLWPWPMAMGGDLSTLTLTLALVVHGWLAGELSVVCLFPGAL